jgi:hypothetical protein
MQDTASVLSAFFPAEDEVSHPVFGDQQNCYGAAD